ncbi:MAG: hypothetical protein PHV62_05855 [Sulfuricurvum sp.]|nr:hypothetical protein [Sulfuricurvum sp.]
MRKRSNNNILANLNPYKVYSFADIGLDGNDSSQRSAFHRSINNNIVKLGKGKFYVDPKGDGDRKKFLHPHGHDKVALKRGSVKAGSVHVSKSIFWSNSNGYIPVPNVIASVIENGSMDDINSLRYRFGDFKVIEVLLNNFDLEKPKYKRISYALGV